MYYLYEMLRYFIGGSLPGKILKIIEGGFLYKNIDLLNADFLIPIKI